MTSSSPLRDICSPYDRITESILLDSTFRAVLSHNDEPTSLQATSIASSKESLDLARSQITRGIDNLQTALHLLRMRQWVLDDLSTQHAGALSSIRRLPDEILAEIFLHACAPHYRLARVHEGPWKLRLVCRKWASIVEHCSELWCNMLIDLSDGLQEDVFLEALDLCHSRHIHITLDLSRLDVVKNQQHGYTFDALFDIITPSSCRWASLAVVDGDGDDGGDVVFVLLELLPRVDGKLPVLRSLTLRGSVHVSSYNTPEPSTALLTAPLLEVVDFRTVSEDFKTFLDVVPLPSQQIRQFLCHSYERFSPDLWKSHLLLSKANFPLLERCEFVDQLQFSVDGPAPERVEHDGVTHLVASQIELFNAVTLPALRVLCIGDSAEEFVGVSKQCNHLKFEDETSTMILNSVSVMLSVSRCSLVSLVLSYDLTLVKEFMLILHDVPTLELLDMRVLWCEGVERDGVLYHFFTLLGTRPQASTFSFLPVLRDLRLSVVGCYWASDGEPAYEAYAASFEYDEPIQPRRFGFIPRALEAMKMRAKYASTLRVFSLKMLMNDSETWGLSVQEKSQLQDLELIKFHYDGILMGREHKETQDEVDDQHDDLGVPEETCS